MNRAQRQALASIQALAAMHGFALAVFTIDDVLPIAAQATRRPETHPDTARIAARVLASRQLRDDMVERGHDSIETLVGEEYADHVADSI